MVAHTRSRAAFGVLGAVAAFTLGCSGLLGYGEEVASASVSSGRAFELTAPASTEPLKLWVTYEVSYGGSDFEVSGKIDHWTDRKADRDRFDVRITREGAPVEGGLRTSLNASHTRIGGKGQSRETLKLVELPASAKPRQIKGVLTAASGTTLDSATLVVTR